MAQAAGAVGRPESSASASILWAGKPFVGGGQGGDHGPQRGKLPPGQRQPLRIRLGSVADLLL